MGGITYEVTSDNYISPKHGDQSESRGWGVESLTVKCEGGRNESAGQQGELAESSRAADQVHQWESSMVVGLSVVAGMESGWGQERSTFRHRTTLLIPGFGIV